MKVYFLNHLRNEEELDGFKIIGIFPSEEKANEAIDLLKSKSGFRDYPESFNVDGYEIDKVFWADGFGFE